MRDKPMACPICGANVKVVEVKNGAYYKCSNNECHFCVGSNYTDEEIALQGKKLNSVCLQCGAPLEVACGPHGLYPKCFECDCDSKPMKVGGVVVTKWANAHSWNAKEEIKNLKKEFKNQNELAYDFEDEEPSITKKVEKISSNNFSKLEQRFQRVLDLLSSSPKKSFSASDISNKLNIEVSTVRCYLSTLRERKLIKITSCKFVVRGSMILYYNLMDSPIPELKIYTESEGYTTASKFHDKVRDKYKFTIALSILKKNIKRNKLQMYPLQFERGAIPSYKEEDLLKMLGLVEKEEIKPIKKTEKREIIEASANTIEKAIIEKLSENLEKPFTLKGISYATKRSPISVRVRVRALVKSKKVKVVGWDQTRANSRGPVKLEYQLKESPLPKLDIIKDNVNYLTINQFYAKRIQGLRKTSLQNVIKLVKKSALTPVPLMINKRAYIGYSIKDLNAIATNLLESPFNSKKPVNRKKVLVKTTAGKSNSQKRESAKKPFNLFNTFFSLFKKSQN